MWDENWEKTKEYLIRSLFQDNPARLTPIPEESVDSSTSVREESFESSNTSLEADSPLPPLVIEMEPNKHDEPPEYYQQLHIKTLRLYRKLFVERLDVDSSITFDVSQNDVIDNEETSAHHFIEGCNYDVETQTEDINIDENTTHQLTESENVERSSDCDNKSQTEHVNNEETRALQFNEHRDAKCVTSIDLKGPQTTDMNNEVTATQQVVECHDGECSIDCDDELQADDTKNDRSVTPSVAHEECFLRSPILRSLGGKQTSDALMENNTDPDDTASLNNSSMQSEIEIMRMIPRRRQSFGFLEAIVHSRSNDIEDPRCISAKNMDETISSTPKTFLRKRRCESIVTSTPIKISKYRDSCTQTAFEDIWDSYYKFNIFAGIPKLLKLCSCRNLCDC